ncbi:MAG: YceD family protein [Acidimicrobiales bacterium]
MASHPFTVDVLKLRRNPGTWVDVRREGPLGGLAISSAQVPEPGEVVVDVRLESVHGAILARGRVEASWTGDCRRCLAPAGGHMVIGIQELYEPGGDPELSYALTGDHIDLAPMARDAILLELPIAPVCDQNCAGLCPVCGADRNQSDCRCGTDFPDPRWSVLDELRDRT